MFEKFQFLYQHVKKDDPKLFETLDKISNHLEVLYNATSELVPNKLYFAQASANLVLVAGPPVAVVGAYINLSLPGTYLVRACYDMQGIGAADVGATIVGQLTLGGTLLGQSASMFIGINGQRATVSQQWKITIGGDQKISLVGYKTAGGGTSVINTIHTTITALLI